jgi:hypothetical protein
MFEYVENANSNVWINQINPGIIGIFDKIGDAEPGIYLNETFLNKSSNLTIFYGLVIKKPILKFNDDCKTKRFLYSVSYSLENERVIDSKTEVLNLDFNSFDNYSINKKIIEPVLIEKNENFTFNFNANAVFKVEHWHLTPHVSCSKNGCTTYYSCDFAGSNYHEFSNSSFDSKEFFTLNENSTLKYDFDYYDGVKALMISIKAENANFILKSNEGVFKYYSSEYPVFVDENNFSHVTTSPTSVYFESGVELLNYSIENNTFNFTLLNVSDEALLTIEFPFDNKTFSLVDNQVNSSLELKVPEFNEPGSVVNASVNLTSNGIPLNDSVFITIDNESFKVKTIDGMGFFQFEMPNESILVEAVFKKDGYYSSSGEKFIIAETSYSNEIILLFSTFLFIGYGFSMITGSKMKKILSMSAVFVFTIILFFILSSIGWAN